MNKQEATQVIRQLVEQVKLNWQEHQVVQQALQILSEDKIESKDA